MEFQARFRNIYKITCRTSDGQKRWTECVKNLVTDEGLEEILNVFWGGRSYRDGHYLGLAGGSPTFSRTDTMMSHPGWYETASYNGKSRATLHASQPKDRCITNDHQPAIYNILKETVIGGAFISTSHERYDCTGKLIAGGAFIGGNRVAHAGDQVEITVSLSAASG